MKLDELRTLKWQIVATAALFFGCIPLAGTVILLRDRFERHMFEDYAPRAGESEGREELRALIDATENEMLDRTTQRRLADLEPAAKEEFFREWMRRPEPPRPHTPRHLVAVDSTFFLKRAEKAVVCGNAGQRERALQFLVWSESPENTRIFERLSNWARHRRLDEVADQLRRFGKSKI